jgi:probable F420-dependent oxidoreductase
MVVVEQLADPGFLAAVGRTAEQLGIHSLWLADHVTIPRGYESVYPYSPDGKLNTPPFPEPLIALTYLAAVTTQVELGTSVLVLPQRNPLLLAKQAATLHQLSSGRFRLGVGVGWLREEFAALGAEFADRGRRTDEYIDAMKSLWADKAPTYSGRYVSLDGTIALDPLPAGGKVPIVVGGHSLAAARRAGARGDGFFPLTFDPALLRSLYREALHEAQRCGRETGSVELLATTDLDPARARQLLELGAGHLVLPVGGRNQDIVSVTTRLERFRDEVISTLVRQ